MLINVQEFVFTDKGERVKLLLDNLRLLTFDLFDEGGTEAFPFMLLDQYIKNKDKFWNMYFRINLDRLLRFAQENKTASFVSLLWAEFSLCSTSTIYTIGGLKETSPKLAEKLNPIYERLYNTIVKKLPPVI